MKAVLIALGVVIGLFGLGAVSVFLAYQSLHDDAVFTENQIVLLSNQSENVLSTTTIKIRDAVGLNKTYTDSLKEVVSAAVQGRYGANGSQATMQWIQEQNPVFDSKVILKVQDIIDGGGTEFKISQDRKMEYCKPYKDKLDSLVRGFFLKLAGFPKKDIMNLCQVISDTDSREAFKTGIRKSTLGG